MKLHFSTSQTDNVTSGAFLEYIGFEFGNNTCSHALLFGVGLLTVCECVRSCSDIYRGKWGTLGLRGTKGAETITFTVNENPFIFTLNEGSDMMYPTFQCTPSSPTGRMVYNRQTLI